MTEKEYEALYEALEAAHKVIAAADNCDQKDAELRKKIRKLEKAAMKRQKKAARTGRDKKKNPLPVSPKNAAKSATATSADLATKASQ